MALEFRHFDIEPIGNLLTVDTTFGWVPVILGFYDSDSDTHPTMEINVAIQYERDWTIDKVRAATLDKAKSLVSAVSEIYEQHDLEGLQQLQDERAAVEQAEVEVARNAIGQ